VTRSLPLILVVAGLLAVPALAHRYHVSIAEAEFNETSQRLEIALNISARDAQEALPHHDDPGRPLSAYVSERWSFVSADGKGRDPVWIGHEIEGDHLWLYFEVPMPGGLDGARIENRMFFELDPRQVNTVNFRQGDWRFGVAYSRNYRAGPISHAND